MVRPISEDLRSRVIAAVEAGLSRRAAADRFGVAVAGAARWVRDWRESGTARAKPQGGDKRSQRIEADRDVILTAIESQVDITLVELAEILRTEHGALFAPIPDPARAWEDDNLHGRIAHDWPYRADGSRRADDMGVVRRLCTASPRADIAAR